MGAKTSTILASFFFFFMLILSSSSAHPKQRKQYKPCKTLVLFFHDIIYNGRNAANATSAIVAAPQGSNLTILAPQFHFGNIAVFDDPITLDNNLHSNPVGRAQGMYIYDTKNTYTAWLGFSFSLNTTAYRGSINFIGADPLMNKTRDVSVVGGTGDFFMHRGVATVMTDAYEGEVYFRLRVDINFYECWAMTLISVGLGRTFHYVDEILPFRFGDTDLPIDDIAAALLLVYFGVSTLLDATSSEGKADDEQREAELAVSEFTGNGAGILAVSSTVISTFALVFVAEWGGKSFFSTIALAAASSPLGVIGGALALATLLAVLGGSILGTFLSEKTIAYVGGVLFLVFAAVTVVEIVS